GDGKGVSHIDFSNETLAAATRPTSQSAGPHPGGEGGAAPPTEGSPATNGLYYGLAVSHDGQTVYAAQGGHDSIAVLSLSHDGRLALRDHIVTRHQDFPAGLALDERGRLYVSNNAAGDDDPYKLTASVAVYDPTTKKEL